MVKGSRYVRATGPSVGQRPFWRTVGFRCASVVFPPLRSSWRSQFLSGIAKNEYIIQYIEYDISLGYIEGVLRDSWTDPVAVFPPTSRHRGRRCAVPTFNFDSIALGTTLESRVTKLPNPFQRPFSHMAQSLTLCSYFLF